MSNEIKPFNSGDLAGRLRERIRDALADLIPDDQWNDMLKREVHEFLHSQRTTYGTAPSGFATTVHEVVRGEVRRRAQEYVTSVAFREQFTDEALAAAITQALSRSTQSVVEGVLKGIGIGVASAVMQQVDQQLSAR